MLYEMLTARRAFAGDDVADTLAAVLRGQPDWSALPADLPAGIALLLRRTLARERPARLRHIGDARLMLDDLASGTVTGRPRREDGVGRRELAAWGLSALLLVSLLAVSWIARRPPLPPVKVRFAVHPPEGVLLTGGGNQISAVFSPDGRKIVYVAFHGNGQGLWLRELDRAESTRLAGTDRAVLPFWSPDSRQVGFFADGVLRVLDLASGTVRTICPALASRGGAWSPNGTIVFGGAAAGGLSRVPASGGSPEPITTVGPPGSTSWHLFPSFLPDGRRFLYQVFRARQLWLGSLDSGETRLVMPADSQAQVLPSGRIFFVRDGVLLAQPFDLERASPSGGPVAIEDRWT